eukprot:CAMPEP_0202962390 /NCGR_PEP_ID=MMETSP1396-20130829/6504_1 /ASSEMBLY_ACC=CAM_ASM_000872 /TAXON_ID= /ORGANISM="Pseudokeronopsis sp., Strain Brazil" /LENGTH=46 /DNA_ID= /DNA_START= /DNA_END= /DNA_ORIENTATION=
MNIRERENVLRKEARKKMKANMKGSLNAKIRHDEEKRVAMENKKTV